VQAVKAGKLEDRYENALGALLNQEAQAGADTNGRETARYRQRRQPDGCAGGGRGWRALRAEIRPGRNGDDWSGRRSGRGC